MIEVPQRPLIDLRPGITLYLIRHGETDWNREARYQGQRDIPINATGRAQAKRHGAVLRDLSSPVLGCDFVASTLTRSKETMRILRMELGLDDTNFSQEPLIAELCYGHWEGQLAAELQHTDPEGLAAKAADPFRWRPHGGESYSDLEIRVVTWLSGLSRDTIAVTHGGVSRVARGALLGIPEHLVPFLDAPQDKILRIRDGAMSWL